MDTIVFFRVYHHWEDPKPYIALKGNPAPDGCKAWIRSLKGTRSHICWFKIQCHEFIGYSTATERDIAYLRSVVDEWLARAGLFLDDFTLGRIDYDYNFYMSPNEFRVLITTMQSRAKSVERSALKLLRHELLIEIPERAYARAEDKLTKELVAAGELHAVELRLKSQKKRGKKITAAVYEYLADCGGKWGALRYDFKGGTAEIILLAEWDTVVSHRFAMRAFEYLQKVPTTRLPEKFMLTFIGPEQFCSSDKLLLEQVIIDDWSGRDKNRTGTGN